MFVYNVDGRGSIKHMGQNNVCTSIGHAVAMHDMNEIARRCWKENRRDL